MAQIDTSMYPRPEAPQNPLQALSSLVGVQSQALNNQVLARSAQAQQAIGEATQGATNPDGSFDPNRFMGLVRGDPRAAFEAQKAQEFAQQQLASQLQVAMQKGVMFNDILGSVISKGIKPDGTVDPDAISAQDVTNAASEAVNRGVIDAKTAASQLGSMPTDSAGRFAWLREHQQQNMDAMAQIHATYGDLLQINNGQQIESQRVSPYGGEMSPVQLQMSPGEAASPVAAVNDKGEPIDITKGSFAQKGSVKTGLSPAEASAQTVTGGGNAQQGMALQTQANEVPQIKAILGHMQGDLKYFSTGPGSKEWKELLAAGTVLGLPVNKNAVASQENFNKFAVMLAQRTGEQFGLNSSDSRFLSTVESNPNQSISSEGNRRIINILKGNADALAAANKGWQAWQAQGHGGETFGQYMTQFNSKIDPRFFQMQYMSKAEQQRMMGGMDAEEKKQFDSKLQNAVSKGWLSDPRKR